jgi:DNA-binding LacI/PurR family transcriptional regulator
VVRQPTEILAGSVWRTLLSRIRGDRSPRQRIEIPAAVDLRQSVRGS